MLCIYVVGGVENISAGCDCFVVVRRIYIIIVVRRGMSFVFVCVWWGCRQLSEPTVVYRFFIQVGVRVV